MHSKTKRVGSGSTALGLLSTSYLYVAIPTGTCTTNAYKGEPPDPGIRALRGLDVVYSTDGYTVCEMSIFYVLLPALLLLFGVGVLLLGYVYEE